MGIMYVNVTRRPVAIHTPADQAMLVQGRVWTTSRDNPLPPVPVPTITTTIQ